METLDNKVAIVTGATGGIGARISDRFIRAGANCVITGRSHEQGAALAAKLGDRATFVAGDLTESDTRCAVVDRALDRWGRLDVLANNAGMDYVEDLLRSPLDEARQVFEVNFFAALAMLQLTSAAMKDGGAIVNVTSRLASIAVPRMGIYGASKGALLALTRAAAVELADRRIRVNAVAPGMTRTPLYEAWLEGSASPEATERAVIAGIPQRRVAEADDVAAAVAFLASDDAAHITGASLPVDGGYTAA